MARNSGGGRRSAFFRGEEGMEQTDREIEDQKRRSEERKKAGSMPFRFRVPQGETREIIICDDKPDFFMYEHGLKDSDGKWGRLFTGCVKTFDNCPVCETQDRESYYAMVLTCVDLTPYTARDGTEVEFSRKLLVVKPSQQKKFQRFYNREGTLRGALFEMSRDGEKDAAIGNDIEFVEFVDDDEMDSYYREWKDRDGKLHQEHCGEPFVYEDLFEEPTVESLRAIVGGEPAPGSRDQQDRELGTRTSRRSRTAATERPRRRGRDDDWEEAQDGKKFGEDEADAADDTETRPRRGRRGRAAEPEAETTPAPRRGRRGRAAEPEKGEEEGLPWKEDEAETRPRRGRRGRAAESEESEESEDSGDDTPPTRPRRSSARAQRASRRSR